MNTATYVSPVVGVGSRTDSAGTGRLREAVCSVLLLFALGTLWAYARVQSEPMCEYMAPEPLPATAATVRTVRPGPTVVADDRDAGL